VYSRMKRGMPSTRVWVVTENENREHEIRNSTVTYKISVILNLTENEHWIPRLCQGSEFVLKRSMGYFCDLGLYCHGRRTMRFDHERHDQSSKNANIPRSRSNFDRLDPVIKLGSRGRLINSRKMGFMDMLNLTRSEKLVQITDLWQGFEKACQASSMSY
jgi:hypothetical protein